MRIGEIQTLRVARVSEFGLYLADIHVLKNIEKIQDIRFLKVNLKKFRENQWENFWQIYLVIQYVHLQIIDFRLWNRL